MPAENNADFLARVRLVLDKKSISDISNQVKSSFTDALMPAQKEVNNIAKNLGKVKAPQKFKQELGGILGYFNDINHAIGKMIQWSIAGTAIFGTLKVVGDTLTLGKEYISTMDELTRITGASTEYISKMISAMTYFGIPLDKASKGMEVFATKLIKAQAEGGTTALLFKKFDVDIFDRATGSALSMEKVLENVRKTAEKYGKSAKTAALSNELFSFRGRGMTEFLIASNAEMEKAIEVAKKYGLVLSKDDLSALDAMSDETNRLKQAQTALGVNIQRALLPTFLTLQKILIDIIPVISSVVEGYGKLLSFNKTFTLTEDIGNYQGAFKSASRNFEEQRSKFFEALKQGNKLEIKKTLEGMKQYSVQMQKISGEFSKNQGFGTASQSADVGKGVFDSLKKAMPVKEYQSLLKSINEINFNIEKQSYEYTKQGKIFENSAKEYDLLLNKQKESNNILYTTTTLLDNARKNYGSIDEINNKIYDKRAKIAQLENEIAESQKDGRDVSFGVVEELQRQYNEVNGELKTLESQQKTILGLESDRNSALKETVDAYEKINELQITVKNSLKDSIASILTGTSVDSAIDGFSDKFSSTVADRLAIGIINSFNIVGKSLDEYLQTSEGQATSIVGQIATATTGNSKIGAGITLGGQFGGIAGSIVGGIVGGLTSLFSGVFASKPEIVEASTILPSNAAEELASMINDVNYKLWEKASRLFDFSDVSGLEKQKKQLQDLQYKLEEVFTNSENNLDAIDHLINMNDSSYNTATERAVAYQQELDKLNNIISTTTSLDTDLYNSLVKSTWALQEKIDAEKRAYQEGLYDLQTKKTTTLSEFTGTGTAQDLLSSFIGDINTRFSANITELDVLKNDLSSSIDSIIDLYKRGVIDESTASELIDKVKEYITEPFSLAIEDFNHRVGIGSEELDTASEQFDYLTNIMNQFKGTIPADELADFEEQLYELSKLVKEEAFTNSMREFNHSLNMGSTSLDTYEEQIQALTDILNSGNATLEEQYSLEEQIYGLQKQINQEYISSIEDRYNQELALHSKMYDTTIEKIVFYTKLLGEATEKGLDPETIKKYQYQLEQLTSPYQSYTDALKKLDYQLELTPDSDTKTALELKNLKTLLSQYGDVLDEETLQALKKRIFNIQIEQNVEITTGDIYQNSDWETIIKRINNLMKNSSSSWSNIVLSKT